MNLSGRGPSAAKTLPDSASSTLTGGASILTVSKLSPIFIPFRRNEGYRDRFERRSVSARIRSRGLCRTIGLPRVFSGLAKSKRHARNKGTEESKDSTTTVKRSARNEREPAKTA